MGSIDSIGRRLQGLNNKQLCEISRSLRFRAMTGERKEQLLPDAFALVREASERTIGMKHFNVQLQAGISLASGAIVEMETGEGKTLTAVLPLYLFSLYGKGAHLATANDYLARRDAETMKPIFELLGCSVGVIQNQSSDVDRKQAYSCDVTYSTASEFGFDLLRDRLRRRVREAELKQGATEFSSERDPLVGRSQFFLLVDEADSVMIDDASTPLIISALSETKKSSVERLFRWAARYAQRARENIEFRFLPHRNKVELTDAGKQWVRVTCADSLTADLAVLDRYEYMERAIKVEREYQRDRNYVVRDGKVAIVDSNIGRIAARRHWQDGIHQAIEARENLQITVPLGSAAQITMQSLVLCYEQRAGMTGTASSSRGEFRSVYRMPTIIIPSRLPSLRRQWPTQVFSTEAEKLQAILAEVRELKSRGRAVLIGTRSVSKSERLSALLKEAAVEHEVLNARHEALEAQIVTLAGQPGRVTVSTSMAGRGTDIKLAQQVRANGGLHVILTELHESARIDRQLIGRCARQGDPGTYRIFLSLDDENLDALNQTTGWKQLLKLLPWPQEWLYGAAQRQIAARSYRERMAMLYHEKNRLRTLQEAGLDPLLDRVE